MKKKRDVFSPIVKLYYFFTNRIVTLKRLKTVSYRRSPPWSSGYPRILLALALEFDSQRGEILTLFAEMQTNEKGSSAVESD